jgi:hypothetical protein
MGRNTSQLVVLFAGLVFCAGCGGDAGPSLNSVKGKVTRGGRPLAKVMVTFTPIEKGPTGSGVTNDNGEYVVISASGKEGAIAGKHKVVLTVAASAGPAPGGKTDFAKMAAERDSKTKAGAEGAPPAATNTEDIVPAEYSDASKTPLSYEVKAGTNNYDIPIP